MGHYKLYGDVVEDPAKSVGTSQAVYLAFVGIQNYARHERVPPVLRHVDEHFLLIFSCTRI